MRAGRKGKQRVSPFSVTWVAQASSTSACRRPQWFRAANEMSSLVAAASWLVAAAIHCRKSTRKGPNAHTRQYIGSITRFQKLGQTLNIQFHSDSDALFPIVSRVFRKSGIFSAGVLPTSPQAQQQKMTSGMNTILAARLTIGIHLKKRSNRSINQGQLSAIDHSALIVTNYHHWNEG